LQGSLRSIEPVLARLDLLLQTPIQLPDEEFVNLVDFVRHGLLDSQILPEQLESLVPQRVPHGRPTLDFVFEYLSILAVAGKLLPEQIANFSGK
jgi:hypothetical protein